MMVFAKVASFFSLVLVYTAAVEYTVNEGVDRSLLLGLKRNVIHPQIIFKALPTVGSTHAAN